MPTECSHFQKRNIVKLVIKLMTPQTSGGFVDFHKSALGFRVHL